MRVEDRVQPALQLVYLPHLDYCLQKFGPGDARCDAEIRELDRVFAGLERFFAERGVRVMVVSEYGIEPVSRAVLPNVMLREAGFLATRTEDGRDLLDAGESAAFAVCDHQAAHVYVRRPEDLAAVRALIESMPGVERVLDRDAQSAAGIAHARAGELVAVAAPGAWFAYRWWEDHARAPDYARTVDIHRKPGYDPLELFMDPAIRSPALYVGARLARRKLGFRALMETVPLDESLVRGSHGRVERDSPHSPVLIADGLDHLPAGAVHVTAVHDSIVGLCER
jgi:predicted AlkP superfamily pyrophosphatase or phosphodiesterase